MAAEWGRLVLQGNPYRPNCQPPESNRPHKAAQRRRIGRRLTGGRGTFDRLLLTRITSPGAGTT
jgi:hypothetical protein